ncbi:ABC transporter [Kocuria dechangensis]|uniref:Transport permease protein n=1 Tax=Kocuria dechangensis TaxID=1176249 RepID=A0A917GUQ3_9MICC|nr:ABC transporter permease [Kocuria dechangensis]GGG56939.1 ABC transporter [Kocuria dechangensis]
MTTTPATPALPGATGGPAPLPRRVVAQARFETVAMLRNGEQLLLLVVLPLMALVALTYTPLLDGVLPAGASRVEIAVPGVLALCVLSNAFSGQGIQTGFDRRYGVLRFLSTTPLGRSGLIAGKLLAILAVLAVQYVLVAGLGAALGWRPGPGALLLSVPVLLLGAAAFTGLGLLLAGTVRAEATLAVTNLVWVLLAAVGGTLFPSTTLPGAASWLVDVLPSGALGSALRETFLTGGPSPAPLVVLAVWALASWAAALRWFRWS